MTQHSDERAEDAASRKTEVADDRELSKANFLEVCCLIEKKFDEYMAKLETLFTTKDEHKVTQKLIWSVGIVSVVSLGVGMIAMGMRLEDALLRIVGVK